MIRPEELKLNNYVNVPRKDQSPFRIDLFEFLNKDDAKVGQVIFEGGHPLTWYLKDLSPIPISIDYLLKFGFEEITEEDDEERFFELSSGRKTVRIVMLLVDDLWTILLQSDKGLNFSQITDIEHLHQLQNLFYALTGEELILKKWKIK